MIILMSLFLVIAQEILFKPKEEFDIKFEMSFKHRDPFEGKSTIHISETRAEQQKRTSSDPLPYLVLNIKLLKRNPAEAKVKVIRDGQTNIMTRKVEQDMQFKLNVGFTDDIKDHIKGYKHEVQFFSADKKLIHVILIEFDREGNYFINNEKRGRI
jgi:hypothetical protein